MSNPTRIRYSEQETGWALPLDSSGTKFRLDNIPYSIGLRFKDVVRTKPSEPKLPLVVEVLERTYMQVALIEYSPDTRERFDEVRAAFKAVGVAMEGTQAGLAIINAKEGVDLLALANRVGFTISHYESDYEDA